MADKLPETPRRRRRARAGALLVPSALALLALVLLAGPALLETARQAAAQLVLPGWSRWHTNSPHSLQGQHRESSAQPGILLADEADEGAIAQRIEAEEEQDRQQQQDRQQEKQPQRQARPAGVASSASDWEEQPESSFLTPVSGCMISPDGE